MNINEIALLAGVSRATVSRYLNDGYVSAEKRAAIAKVIERTGYTPSSQAQTLRTGRTRFVGVIIPKINSESVARMVAGITQALSKHGYHLLLANTDNDEQAEVEYLRAFTANQVDGIILISTVLTPEHVRAIAELSVPLVVLGQEYEGLTCVHFDDYHAVYDLTQGLCGTCKHPAHLGVTTLDAAAGAARTQAFVDAMEAEGIPRNSMVIEHGDFTIESGYEMAERVLEEHPEVDAMVCATDTIAAGALAALRDAGRRVPEDVQVTGIGDSEMCRALFPHLTTVHNFYRTSGASAAQIMVEAIEGGEIAPRSLRMGYQIVLRDSTLNE